MNDTELNAEVEDILREDARRMALLDAPFDPMSGVGCPGERFLISNPSLSPSSQWIPESMRQLPQVAALIRGESLCRVFASPSAEVADRAWFRLRARHDFSYWAFLTVKVKPKKMSSVVPFRLNRAQRKLVGVFEEMRVAGLPIRVILLKARQWGGSTVTQMYMLWLQLMRHKGCNSLIISHQVAGTDEILSMAKRTLSEYPRDLLVEPEEEMPMKEKVFAAEGMSRSAIYIPRREFKIKVGSAERPDSSRGGDYALVHLSEVGLWKETLGKKPEDIMRAATAGVLEDPETMIVMESTANGIGNFFEKSYSAAKKGSSMYRAVFVSWFEIEQYARRIEDRRAFAEKLIRGKWQTAVADMYLPTGSYLWSLWEKGASLEAIAWYEWKRTGYSDADQMAAEYPSDDVEAFVNSGAHVFNRHKVLALRKRCRPPMAIGRLVANADSGEDALAGVEFEEDSNGLFKVWEWPDRGEDGDDNPRYLVVVDVGGRGLKSDWSVIAVFDRIRTRVGGPVSVVAQWRGHCDMDELAWMAARIAFWYDEALLVIESNTLETRDRDRIVDGDQSKFILNQIRDVYPCLYARAQSPEDIRQGAPRKYGFHTNTGTKPMIISNLVKVVRETAYVERDSDCLDEFLTYERRRNGSYGAIPGKHDDLLMTRAIGLHIALNEMRPLDNPESQSPAAVSHPMRNLSASVANLFGW